MAASVELSNSVMTLINGVSFNRTTLLRYGYTYYSNGTLSNDTSCYLVFEQYQPTLNEDGSFINATSCYDPSQNIKSRGALCLLFGCLFASTIILTVVNLRKAAHRSRRLELRRRDILSRRWQWYWLIVAAVCGLLSAFTGVDMDRDYVLNTPIVLQAVFFDCLKPLLLAALWEAVKNWIKNYRQTRGDDMTTFEAYRFTSARVLWFSVLFYILVVAALVIEIARSWTPIELQRSSQQALAIAKPMATDVRFKVSSYLYIGIFSAISIMAPQNKISMPQGLWWLVAGILALSAFLGYGIAAGWAWKINPFNVSISTGWLFGLGYAPALLTIVFLNLYGLLGSFDEDARVSLASMTSAESKPLTDDKRHYPTVSKLKWRNSNDGSIPHSSRNSSVTQNAYEMRPLPVQNYKDVPLDVPEQTSSWLSWKSSAPGDTDDPMVPRRSLQSQRSRRTGDLDFGNSGLEDVKMTSRRTRWTEDTTSTVGTSFSGVSSRTLQANPQVVRSMLQD